MKPQKPAPFASTFHLFSASALVSIDNLRELPYYYYLVIRRNKLVGTVTAKLSDDDDRKLLDICKTLRIDKSDALRRSIHQTWLALQLGRTFVERAGGHPEFLLNSGDSEASQRSSRKEKIDAILEKKRRRRKSSSS